MADSSRSAKVPRGVLTLLAALAALAVILLWPREPPSDPPPVPVTQLPLALPASSPPHTPALPLPVPIDDAGELERTGVVTIALLREGLPVVGPRITLRNAQGAEGSRPTDVMGLAAFELPLGSWLVMAPEELGGPSIEVTAEPSRVTLTLPPLRRVEGEVLDEKSQPVTNILIMGQRPQVRVPDEHALPAEPDDDPRVVARTDDDGRFSFTTVEESLDLEVVRGTSRAGKRVAPPVSDVKLVLEQVALLSVIPPQNALVLLSLSSRTQTLQRQLSGPAALRVPVGELDVRGLMTSRGQLLRTTHHLVVKADQPNVLRLEFAAPPPVGGLVLDLRGLPLRGVRVGLTLAPSPSPRAQETTVTDEQGRFQLVPRLVSGGDPVYEVHVLPPWHERNRVLVRLGDGPLIIDAEPSDAGAP